MSPHHLIRKLALLCGAIVALSAPAAQASNVSATLYSPVVSGDIDGDVSGVSVTAANGQGAPWRAPRRRA